MKIWFSWNENGKYINVVLGFIIIFNIVWGKVKLVYTKNNIISFLLLSLAWIIYGFGFNNVFGLILGLSFLPAFWVIICFNDEDKIECLNCITNWFTYLLIPSIILYIISYIFPLPSLGKIQIDSDYLSYLPYDNYIFLVKSPYYMFRFTGPFLEPGHLGMMIMFLLFSNRCDFHKWQVVVLFVISLFTLSLASYMLFIICYFFCMISIGNKLACKKIIYCIIFIIMVYYISQNYNNGHNYVNDLIIERLQYDQEKGFSGNNRVAGEIEAYYDFMLNNENYFWTGYDYMTIKHLAETGSRGTGYMMYVVRYGFLGLLITSLFYLYYAYNSKYLKYSFFFLLFVCITFWQRCYPFWTSWVMCYVWGICSFERKKIS